MNKKNTTIKHYIPIKYYRIFIFLKFMCKNVADKQNLTTFAVGFVLPNFIGLRKTLDALWRMFQKHSLSIFIYIRQ